MDSFVERVWLRAQRYIADGQVRAARIALESLIQRDPGHVAGRMLLASVHLDEGRVREAAEQAIAASGMLPDDADAVATAVHCLLRIGETRAALDCLTRFDAGNKPLDGRQLTVLAHVYQMLGDHATGLVLMDRAQAQGHDNPDFRYFHALQMQFNGRVVDARHRLESCLQLGPTFGRASLALARMGRQTADSNHVDYIRAQLQAVAKGSEDHAGFEFALYKELEDLGHYEEAFAALDRGNAIMYSRMSHDVAREGALFDGIKRLATADFMRGEGAKIAGPIPIFVVGLPRSGTTLLDRILDNHPDVVSTGERIDFPRQLRWAANRHGNELIDAALLERLSNVDYAELGKRYLAQTQWRAQGSLFFVDKLPANQMLLGLIHRALPQAPILHMVRDPMDVCFSNYKALFGESYPYSYEKNALAAHYVQYRALMQHWHATMPGRVLDVSYSELVRDPEAVLPSVFAHCGLRWVADCNDLTRNTGAVNTLSSAQIREPIHTRTLGEWRRYERQLAPVQGVLQSAGLIAAPG
ncbi:MAG TPA: sulfotransferase [Rhodanobacteraceae bacterium]|nr:sulfotransferase [Rhodanobacteraceae bacterium]